jgi:hypothetical protein
MEAVLKAESEFAYASDPLTYNSTFVNMTTGAMTPVATDAVNVGRVKEKAWVPELDVRYTGIKGMSLFANAEFRQAPSGSESATGTNVSGNAAGAIIPSFVVASKSSKENHGSYKVGANWTVSPTVTVRAEGFTKKHVNGFYNLLATGQYITDYRVTGTQMSAAVKLMPTLTSTTRYAYQKGNTDVGLDGTLPYNSGKSISQTFAESIDWNPNTQFYMQANLNVVFDTLQTVYPRAGTVGDYVLHNSDNNYKTASVLAGFVVDKETDAEVQYTYYKANNYDATMALATTPHGAGGKSYSLTAGLKHKFSDKLVGSCKVGYFDSTDELTGGYSNYKGTLVYAGLTYAF